MKRKKTRKTNQRLLELINRLEYLARKGQAKIWKRVAKELKKPRSSWRAVNLIRIEKYAKPGYDIVVPGKVLGYGKITKKLRIIAYDFSSNAKEKIIKAGGDAIKLKDYIEVNKKGKKTLLIG